MNRIENSTPEALEIEAYDQAATALYASHAGFEFPPLSLTKPREDGWRYRDEVVAALGDRIKREGGTDDMLCAGFLIWAIGSAAQNIAQNGDDLLQEIMPLPRKIALEHWSTIERIARALLTERELSPERVAALRCDS